MKLAFSAMAILIGAGFILIGGKLYGDYIVAVNLPELVTYGELMNTSGADLVKDSYLNYYLDSDKFDFVFFYDQGNVPSIRIIEKGTGQFAEMYLSQYTTDILRIRYGNWLVSSGGFVDGAGLIPPASCDYVVLAVNMRVTHAYDTIKAVNPEAAATFNNGLLDLTCKSRNPELSKIVDVY